MRRWLWSSDEVVSSLEELAEFLVKLACRLPGRCDATGWPELRLWPDRRRPDQSDLAVAGGMAFLAGATDVYGLGALRDLYVSFKSGNTTMLGVALGYGDWRRSVSIAALIGLFVTGAAAGAVLGRLDGRRHAALAAAAVAVALAAPLLRPAWGVAPLVLAMGALNAAIRALLPTTRIRLGWSVDGLRRRPGCWPRLIATATAGLEACASRRDNRADQSAVYDDTCQADGPSKRLCA